MAIILSSAYPSQVDTDPAYPHGKARNAGSFQDGTGTPLEKTWLNDIFGFLQALLVAADVTPSGDPDTADVSQYLQAVGAAAVAATWRRNVGRALAMRALDLAGVTPGTSTFLGAASLVAGETVVAKAGANGAFSVVDTPLVKLATVTVTGLTELRKIIQGGGRLLAIGDGGSKNAFSTGGSWTAGGSTGLAATPTDGVWDGTNFVISTETGKAAHSTNGVAWAGATGGSDIINAIPFNPAAGLAALAGGHVVAAGALVDHTQKFAVSSDHGLTWAAAGSIPAGATYLITGQIAGNLGDQIYWVGKPDGESRLDVYASPDGDTWELRAEIPDFTGAFPIPPRIYMCQDTGLLVVVQDLGAGIAVSASIDRGYTWSALAYYNALDCNSIAVARGRIFATIGTKLFATDVI